MDDIAMTRARLFVLIDAFERDARRILRRFVLDEIGELEGLGTHHPACLERREKDATSDSAPLVDYLNLRDAYDLLNTHRGMLPSDLATEVRELTNNLDQVTAVRNRVMHARPLAPGDGDSATSLLNQFKTSYWTELRRTLTQLRSDSTWEPVVPPIADSSLVLHNLPLPDYDDTGLIGRQREIDDVITLLHRRREPVITVTGEGGIGKTALAIAVAYQLVDESIPTFEVILWASLKYEKLTAFGVREIHGAARDIVGALNSSGDALGSDFAGSLENLAESLSNIRTLLVLDNLETVDGQEFRDLYETLPESVSYLITSRIGVGEYERRYPLPALSDRDSLQLFNQFVRARRISSLARLSNNARVNVVQKLRYSPLAIKWFALAVDAGNEPLDLLRRQDELLEFCVRSVYREMSGSAREVLTALAILGRPLTADELIVLLDCPIDEVRQGVQELMRGSLVRRQTVGTGDDLTLQIALTDTAVQFLERRVQPDAGLQEKLTRQDKEFREAQERRAQDRADRSLAPIVVRERTASDAPACNLLRRALLDARKSDYQAAFKNIDVARQLNPEFWEVDRVEGFVKDAAGKLSAATACYERAYSNAAGEDRAVVAHFFAGHLARKVRDIKRAIVFAREADQELQLPETAVALGNYLVWQHEFADGIRLIEKAVPLSRGKSKVIAITTLSEAWRRYGEVALTEERNPIVQFERAWKGFDIAWAAMQSGVADDRLRGAASSCAVVALRGLIAAHRANLVMTDLPRALSQLEAALVLLVGAREWDSLVGLVHDCSVVLKTYSSVRRLAATMASLTGDEMGSDKQPALIGEIVNVSSKFGFIKHDKFPTNCYFSPGGVTASYGISSLRAGMLVYFQARDDTRGPVAYDVHPVEIPRGTKSKR